MLSYESFHGHRVSKRCQWRRMARPYDQRVLLTFFVSSPQATILFCIARALWSLFVGALPTWGSAARDRFCAALCAARCQPRDASAITKISSQDRNKHRITHQAFNSPKSPPPLPQSQRQGCDMHSDMLPWNGAPPADTPTPNGLTFSGKRKKKSEEETLQPMRGKK